MRKSRTHAPWTVLLILVSLFLWTTPPVQAAPPDDLELREWAAQRVHWWRDHPDAHDHSALHVKVLAINDFHGQIGKGKTVGGRPVGSAAVLATYLKQAQAEQEEHTLIAHAGDHVGASPPNSALLQDEPSIMFLNLLGNRHCSVWLRVNSRCNLVGTVGNHEFDDGMAEMRRLIYGGNYSSGPFLEQPWRGATFPYVSANVVDAHTGHPILRPYVIKVVDGIPIAFIGAVLKETPTIVTASGVAGVNFLDEADAINRYIPELRALRVRTIIALIHQGDYQNTYDGSTDATKPAPTPGALDDIVRRLDDAVDVVISGHSHGFTNALMPNKNGKQILVTQAFSAGTAYADIELDIDRTTRDVVAKSAAIITTYADVPGVTPDPAVAQLVANADTMVAPLVNRHVGTAAGAISQLQNSTGESALGDLIADAQRAAMGADLAFMNPGGIRADIAAGDVKWGDLYAVQPFNNYLVKMSLNGDQIYTLLEQQWLGQSSPRMLQLSGLTYTWDFQKAVGSRIVDVRKNNVSIVRTQTYTVIVNSFLADGGDNFTILKQGTNRVVGPIDLDGLVTYISGLPQPFSAPSDSGRISRLN